jgi:voltage-gated potassium channel
MSGPRDKIQQAILVLVAVIVVGTFGYKTIEGWPWFDCFYMTIVTVATIGFQEPIGITEHGRYVTAALIIVGVWAVGYSFSLLAQAAVQGGLLSELGRRRVQEKLRNLSDHLIICGGGRVGAAVAAGLAEEGIDFVIVDTNRDLLENFAAREWLTLHGDARVEEVLLSAGIERARGLVCALASDADNVFIVLTARDLVDAKLYIVARVNDESTISKMRKAGADKIVSPIGTGSRQMLQALLRPNVAEFMEFATMREGLDLVIEEIVISDYSTLSGKSLRDLDMRKTLDIIIIAILRGENIMLFSPTADTVLVGGDTLIVIGNRAGIKGLEELAVRDDDALIPFKT